MKEWLKGCKDKTFLKILAIALVTMAVAGLCANFLEWGWILSCLVAVQAGFIVRRIVVRKLKEQAGQDQKE